MLLDSPRISETQLFHEGARAAQPLDSSLQNLLQSWVHVGQPLQIHTAPQRLVQSGTDTRAEATSQTVCSKQPAQPDWTPLWSGHIVKYQYVHSLQSRLNLDF